MSINKDVMVGIIAGLIIGGLFGAAIGSYLAAEASLTWCVDRAIHFLELKGIELEIDEEEIVWAIKKYRDYIDKNYR